jgi:hypothetical protein
MRISRPFVLLFHFGNYARELGDILYFWSALIYLLEKRKSSVGIATCYGLDDRAFRFPTWIIFFSSP